MGSDSVCYWYAGRHVCSKVLVWRPRLSVCQDLKPLFSSPLLSDLRPLPFSLSISLSRSTFVLWWSILLLRVCICVYMGRPLWDNVCVWVVVLREYVYFYGYVYTCRHFNNKQNLSTCCNWRGLNSNKDKWSQVLLCQGDGVIFFPRLHWWSRLYSMVAEWLAKKYSLWFLQV